MHSGLFCLTVDTLEILARLKNRLTYCRIYEVLQFMKIGLIRSESSLQTFDWLSPYLECCPSRSETFGVTWEHGALSDVVKIQIQHDHTFKTLEGKERSRVN